MKLALRLGGLLIAALTAVAAPATEFAELPAVAARAPGEAALTALTRAGDRLVAVGERGLIAVSDDDGASWQQATVPTSQLLTAVTFATDNLGWAVGHGGVILHTRDGGDSWQRQFDGYAAAEQWLAYTRAKLSRLQAEYDALGTTSDSNDADNALALEDLEYAIEDATFDVEDAEIALAGGPADPFLAVLFTTASRGWAAGAYGMLYETQDGGETWSLAVENIDNPDRFHYYGMALLGSGEIVLSGESGLLFVSDAAVTRWQRIEGVYEGSLFGAVADGQRAVVFGLRGNAFQSTDRGQSWQRIALPVQNSLHAATLLGPGDIVLVGTAGTVVRLNSTTPPRYEEHPSRVTLSGVIKDAAGGVVLVGSTGALSMEVPADG